VADALASPSRGLAQSARRALASLGEHLSEALHVMHDPQVRGRCGWRPGARGCACGAQRLAARRAARPPPVPLAARERPHH
jgi:hypothetical protein